MTSSRVADVQAVGEAEQCRVFLRILQVEDVLVDNPDLAERRTGALELGVRRKPRRSGVQRRGRFNRGVGSGSALHEQSNQQRRQT